MKKTTILDVLVVYTEVLAKSAGDVKYTESTPFSKKSRNATYNLVYSYFLETCKKNNLKVGFTTSADIIGAGTCRSFWTFINKKWVRNLDICYSTLIFDKFSPTTVGIKERRGLLFSNNIIVPFNNPELFNIFFDKHQTYSALLEHSIPTMLVETNTNKSVNKACKTLSLFMNSFIGSDDFTDDIVMKDRYGAGGRHVYKFESGKSTDMLSIVKKNASVSFIIQPFVKFDKGYNFLNSPASTDIRVIYLKGKIIQSYIRVAKKGDFRCNEHKGGSLNYLELSDIPIVVKQKAELIAKTLNKNCSFFALDFVISNSGNVYLLEGNTGPGLDWNISIKKNEKESKKLIRLLVKDLYYRTVATPLLQTI